MDAQVPHFRVPLNLPHACTISGRILYHLGRKLNLREMPAAAPKLLELLRPYHGLEDNPPKEEAERTVREGARLGRELVDEIERRGLGDDRVGQAIRNLFECFELGEEGAVLSLRAGENPDSALRPR